MLDFFAPAVYTQNFGLKKWSFCLGLVSIIERGLPTGFCSHSSLPLFVTIFGGNSYNLQWPGLLGLATASCSPCSLAVPSAVILLHRVSCLLWSKLHLTCLPSLWHSTVENRNHVKHIQFSIYMLLPQPQSGTLFIVPVYQRMEGTLWSSGLHITSVYRINGTSTSS